MTDRDLMMRFCSLGPSCEFGIAQRAGGAEPLDLLRWASTPLRVLIAMLNARFDGIGSAADLGVRWVGREFMVDHKRYGFSWHAFAPAGMSAEDVRAREAARLPRLAEKLMDDLAEGRRIFVRADGNIRTARDVESLSCAMDQFGAPVLMFVTEDAECERRLEAERDRLLHGRIGAFADPANVPSTTDSPAWLTLCRQAFTAAGMSEE